MKDLWEVNMKSLLVQIKNVYLLVKNVFILLCLWVFCLHLYLCTMCLPSAQGSQKRALALLELGMLTVVNCHVGSGSWTESFEEEPVLLITEQSLQLSHLILNLFSILINKNL